MAEIKVTSKPEMKEVASRMSRATKNMFGGGRGDLEQLAGTLVQYVQMDAPKKTGQSASAIRSEVFMKGLTVGFRVILPEVYSKFVIPGTRAHVITPRHAKVLRFVVGGSVVFTQRVNHPGTKPNPFPNKSLAKWRPTAQTALTRIGNRWVTEVSA